MSVTPPPDGTPWWAWAAVVVLLAVIPWLTTRAAQRPLHKQVAQVVDDAAATRTQVQNSHRTNLRDDLDAMRVEMRSGFAELTAEQRATRLDVGGLRAEVRTERQERADLGERVTELERRGRQGGERP